MRITPELSKLSGKIKGFKKHTIEEGNSSCRILRSSKCPSCFYICKVGNICVVFGALSRRGGVGKSPNIVSGWGGIAGGVGHFSVSFGFLLKRGLRNLNVLCYIVNEMYDMKCI